LLLLGFVRFAEELDVEQYELVELVDEIYGHLGFGRRGCAASCFTLFCPGRRFFFGFFIYSFGPAFAVLFFLFGLFLVRGSAPFELIEESFYINAISTAYVSISGVVFTGFGAEWRMSRSFISCTALSSPVNIARDIIVWPMLSS
jgi:hypothetical protein